MMIQERLNDLRPYVTGIRFVKDMGVVDVVLKEGWDVYESDVVTYKPSQNNKNYFMFYPVDQGSNDFDMILDHVEGIISGNLEKEHKLVLLKAKIEELKMWFNTKPLSELERLKFKIEDIEEASLSDLSSSTDVDDEPPQTHKGIELPPTNNVGEEKKEVEKEEV
jgi:hypothetical protein